MATLWTALKSFCKTDYFYFVNVPRIPDRGKTDVFRCLERCSHVVQSRGTISQYRRYFLCKEYKNKAYIGSLTAFCFSN